MASIITRLTTSGNSKAVRLTKDLLEMSRLGDVVEIEAKRGQIVIRNSRDPRAGWRTRIANDLKTNGSLAKIDEYGDLAVEREATLGDGLDKW